MRAECVRLFVATYPPHLFRWSQVGYDVLKALLEQKIPTRAIGLNGTFSAEGPWDEVAHSFNGPFPASFVNVVVCAGAPLERLWTKGCYNVAISGTIPRPPTDHERICLSTYHAILTPTQEEADVFASLGVHAVSKTIPEMATFLGEYLED